jgi:hypothetical protein
MIAGSVGTGGSVAVGSGSFVGTDVGTSVGGTEVGTSVGGTDVGTSVGGTEVGTAVGGTEVGTAVGGTDVGGGVRVGIGVGVLSLVGGTFVGGTLVGGTLVGGTLVGGTLVGTRVGAAGVGSLVRRSRVSMPGWGVRVGTSVRFMIGVGVVPVTGSCARIARLNAERA